MNQHQITVTRGDDRLLEFELPADYSGGAVQLRVDGLFSRDGTLEAGSGGTTLVEVALAAADTDSRGRLRRAYPYTLQVTTAEDEVLTVRRGLFVVVPEVEDPEA
jgi:hypothetical protein